MSNMIIRIALAGAVVAGSASVASAQGFDPSGANRGYAPYAAAARADYYLGQLQGSMAKARIAAPFASAPVRLSRADAPVRAHRPRVAVARPAAPAAAPAPGSVTPLE
jgi:hypothetical protein